MESMCFWLVFLWMPVVASSVFGSVAASCYWCQIQDSTCTVGCFIIFETIFFGHCRNVEGKCKMPIL